ncbi:DUF1990 family protein [Sporichthya polymorpha]|uniref:DUF1990 family protein n=1 Tax=Sporichthya polymorpha TaxID=35751 RepID=UPI0006842CE5|nr:DUF1990 domain-containing protein [Sporichthya polymorpha]
MRLHPARSLRTALARAESDTFTYPDVGATAGDLPAGYHHLHHRVRVGAGPDALDRAEAALTTWHAQSGSGLVVAADGPVAEGRTVVLGLGRPLSLVIPCRVVWTLHEPDRRGFAYGTLPGHPESGEESFVLTPDDDGSVWLTITAFTNPGNALVRALGPGGRAIQTFFVRRYGAAIRRSVSSEPGTSSPR